MPLRRILIGLLVLWLGLSSQRTPAEPAWWYQWQSQVNHKDICRQTSPGAGWQQSAGPFLDARCTRAVRPRRR